MDMHQCDEYIKENIGRKLVLVGASTGTDAHTVGIDAIMNMKGYAGHYGLERYDMIDAYNLGSQVPNEEFLAKAVELGADALLVSQTVTQMFSLPQTSWFLRNLCLASSPCPVETHPIPRSSMTLSGGSRHGQQEAPRQQPKYKSLSKTFVPTAGRLIGGPN